MTNVFVVKTQGALNCWYWRTSMCTCMFICSQQRIKARLCLGLADFGVQRVSSLGCLVWSVLKWATLAGKSLSLPISQSGTTLKPSWLHLTRKRFPLPSWRRCFGVVITRRRQVPRAARYLDSFMRLQYPKGIWMIYMFVYLLFSTKMQYGGLPKSS